MMTIEGRIKDCLFLGGKIEISAKGVGLAVRNFGDYMEKNIQQNGTIRKDNNKGYLSGKQKGGKEKRKKLSTRTR